MPNMHVCIQFIRNKSSKMLCVFLTMAVLVLGGLLLPCSAQEASGIPRPSTNVESSDSDVVIEGSADKKPRAGISTEQHIVLMWEAIQSIKTTVEMAELRSYQNKMMARELTRWVRAGVVVLIVIAAGFPLTVYLLSRKRILGLSQLSSEMSATLVTVEERQNKLANVLKEIQGEMDYLNSMSVPDLERLIKQAETYLAQNEQELRNVGRSGNDS